MPKFTDGQMESYDPQRHGWSAAPPSSWPEFTEIKDRAMVWEREFFLRDGIRLVVEWTRAGEIKWAALNGQEISPLTWDTLIVAVGGGPRWRVMKGDELIGRAEQWSNDRNVINHEDPKSVGDWQYLAMGSEWSHTGSQELREVEPGVRAVYAIREPWDRMAGYMHEDTGIRIVDAWHHGQ